MQVLFAMTMRYPLFFSNIPVWRSEVVQIHPQANKVHPNQECHKGKCFFKVKPFFYDTYLKLGNERTPNLGADFVPVGFR
jgi:hypothetical protein